MTLCNWRHRNVAVAVVAAVAAVAVPVAVATTGNLIMAHALTSLWRWRDLICLAHNLS